MAPTRRRTARRSRRGSSSDPDGEIRADAARVLAMTVGKGKVAGGISDALVALLDDSDRDVRLIGIRAIGDARRRCAEVRGHRDGASCSSAPTRARSSRCCAPRSRSARPSSSGIAVADSSPLVRVAAVDAALGSGMRAGATLSAGARRRRPAGPQGRARASRARRTSSIRRSSIARCRSRSAIRIPS